MSENSQNPFEPDDNSHHHSGDGFWNVIGRWSIETFDGWFEFVGMAVGGIAIMCGGFKRIVFAFGCACLSGGLGLAIEFHEYSGGAKWMAIGGFFAGLAIPIADRLREKN